MTPLNRFAQSTAVWVAAAFVFPGVASASEVMSEEAVQSANAEIDSSGRDVLDEQSSDNVIIVQARRRDEDVQTVPIAITAFGSDTLAARSVVTTQDLTALTPGLVVAPALSRDVPAIVIRGQQRLASGIGAPAVVTYFADVPLSVQGSLLPTFDIQSVQVLKGPQGTLFGRNTTGGAILVYPKAPSYDFGGYVQASYGEYDERTLEGAINIPVVQDKFAVRLAGQIARRDGYTENVGVGDDLDDRHTDLFRVSALIEPSDAIKNTTIFDYYKAEEAGTATVLRSLYPNESVPFGGIPRSFPFNLFFDNGAPGTDLDLLLEDQQELGIRAVNYDFDSRSNRELWGITNITEIDLGSLQLKNIFGYRSTEVDSSRDFDGTPLPINGQSNIFSTQQWSNEFQVLGNIFDERVDYIIGAFYLLEEPNGSNEAANEILVAPFNPPTFGETYAKTESTALFAQASISLDDLLSGLEISAGFRYTWDKIDGCQVNGANPAAVSGSFAGCRTNNPQNITVTKSNAPTWSFGINYEVSDDLFLYATTRRGYRAAGPNGAGFADSISDLENYAPEEVTDLELGLKSNFELAGSRATFNIAAYTSSLTNFQRTTVLGPNFDGDGDNTNDPFAVVLNAAEATISGVELDASIQLSSNITVGGFLNYTDAGFDRFDVEPALLAVLGPNPTDNRFPYVPSWTGGIYFDAQIPLGDIGELILNTNLYQSGQLQFNDRPGDPAGIENGYTIVNARFGIEELFGTSVSASVFARNLFNEEYAAAAGFVVPTFTTGTVVYGEPRIIGVELSFKFGN